MITFPETPLPYKQGQPDNIGERYEIGRFNQDVSFNKVSALENIYLEKFYCIIARMIACLVVTINESHDPVDSAYFNTAAPES